MTTRKTTPKKKVTKGKTTLTKTNERSKFAQKTQVEKEEIKAIISVGIRKSHSVQTIMKDLEEKGLKASNTSIYAYIKEIRESWRTAMSEQYETHVASQFAKLDLMEERLWQMLDKSMLAEEKKTIERQGGRLLTEKTETKTKNGDVEIMLAIERIWVRRNEILGIASSTINIQNNVQNNITENTTVEVTKVEFQPVSDKFFGNFVIEQAYREKP